MTKIKRVLEIARELRSRPERQEDKELSDFLLDFFSEDKIRFSIDGVGLDKLAEWIDSISDEIGHGGASGGHFTYSFTPTSLGTVVVITENTTKKSINITDYGSW